MINQNDLHRKQLFAALLTGIMILALALSRIITGTPPSQKDEKYLLTTPLGLHWVNRSEGARIQSLNNNYNKYSPFFFAPVSVNFADKDLLMTLPGVGPGMVEQIINYRNEHDSIDNETEFMQIRGIGDKRMEKLRNYITFDK